MAMTRDQIIERVSRIIGSRCPDAQRTEEVAAATAIVDMVGPKELGWREVEDFWLGDGFEIRKFRPGQVFKLWACRCDGADAWPEELGTYPTLEAAKAAAQAHHEEQHWMRTRIWGDE